jgi:hypothetical protein
MVSMNKGVRRGVLLLVVLSVLTLFLMLGATYLAVATRARKASRAFADNVVAATNARATEARLLDEVFLTVARGTTLSLTTGTSLANGDDLLGDKYGTNSLLGLTGSAAVFQSSPAFIQVSVSGTLRPAAGSTTSGSNVSDLVGRVVTLNLPGLAASTRIVSATGSITSPTLVIPAGPTPAGSVISVPKINAGVAAVSGTSATTLVINGREFDGTSTNEPYDGFDSRNPLLTRIIGNTSGPPTVAAAPLTGTTSLDVDNDGDGVGDSAWIDLNLPPIIDASGRSLRPQAAILVVDLDGRLNVNAHGSTVDAESFDPAINKNKYPTYTTGSTRPSVPLYQLPRGVASGPATISLSRSLLFSGTTTEQAVLEGGLKIFGGQQAKQRQPDSVTGREVPALRNTEGRYADGAWTGSFTSIGQPGVSGSNDRISLDADRWRATLSGDVAQSYFTDPGRFGSPWDVKGRMKLWVDGFGQPVYYKPSWGTGAGENDVIDDPYEVNLTRTGARTGYTAAPRSERNPPDNLYTPADLEGLLRYNDPDSLKLPRRLVALNEDQAGRNRLLVTTESWDTPAITGTSWQATIGTRFAALLTSATATAPRRARDLFGPELVMGHKLDLNRPFHDAPNFDEPNDATGTGRRQAYARQLYCLMMAVGQQNGLTVTSTTARQIAQYAINVVDYRDGDSVMTKFEYDPAFTGTNTTWTTGSTNYVWGCERPELLITETLAWHNRRTDDLPEGGQIQQQDQRTADDDLDQSLRPWGAFFVELYSPWSSQYAQYASGSVSLSGTNGRGEPVPQGLTASGSATFGGTATISLNKRAAGTSPVWRLASVRGKVQGGAGFHSTGFMRDPSIPEVSGSTAPVDRVFYFAPPAVAALTNPTDLRDGQPGGIFWTTGTATAQPSPSQHVVVGTDGLGFNPALAPIASGSAGYSTATAPNLPYIQQVHLRFDSPKNNARTPATLSEPVNTINANKDPYESVAEAVGGQGNNKFTPDDSAEPHRYSDNITLQKAIDAPLDGNVTAVADVSAPFLTHADSGLPAGRPLLMFNGTHDNFAVIHLQRLADPEKAWNASDNPYITVDSMPVDLTVVNSQSGNLAACFDEPGQSPCLADSSGDLVPGAIQPGPNALTWLQTQKAFGPGTQNRFSTTERSGKQWQTPPGNVSEHDIWSRRATILKPTTSGTSLLPLISAPDALRSAESNVRPAGTLSKQGTAPNERPRLDAVAPAPALADATFKLTTNTNEVATPSRWAREEFDADNDGVPNPVSEDKNSNGLFDPPRYAWLAWPNRPFSSIVDLALVPTTSPFDLTGKHSIRTTGTDSPDFYHLPNFFEDTPPSEPWLSLAGRTGSNAVSLFDFVHIPSPFAGVYATVPLASNTNALTTLGLNSYPVNTLSSFREPGKVNINTMTDRRVWRALFGDVNVRGTISGSTSVPGTDDPFAPTPDLRDRLPGWSASLFAQPETTGTANSPTRATNLLDFFRNMADPGYDSRPSTPRNGGFVDSFTNEDANTNGVLDYGEDANKNGVLDAGEDANDNGVLDTEDRNRNFALDLNYHRDTDRNAYFRYQTMRQLSNVVTTRSNVYAVWITIRYLDPAGQEVQPYRRSRAFYIFDRSIPVAYERGEDHNVRDAILLRRIIQ